MEKKIARWKLPLKIEKMMRQFVVNVQVVAPDGTVIDGDWISGFDTLAEAKAAAEAAGALNAAAENPEKDTIGDDESIVNEFIAVIWPLLDAGKTKDDVGCYVDNVVNSWEPSPKTEPAAETVQNEAAPPSPMWKSTIVIWTDYDPTGVELSDLAREAVSGDAYCSKQGAVVVEDAAADPDWDGTGFFGSGDDLEDAGVEESSEGKSGEDLENAVVALPSEGKSVYYVLIVMYPPQFYPGLDEELEDILGRRSGSGMGLGMRDCDWVFATEEERELAEKKLDPLVEKYGEDLEISHGDIPEDEDEDETAPQDAAPGKEEADV